MIYSHLLAGLIGATMAAVGAWNVQSWRYGEQIASMKQEASEATTRAVKDAMAKTAVDQKRKDDALIEANKKARSNAVAADSARRVAISLRDQLASARADLPSSTIDAARNYAAAVSGVFGQCTERLTEMARIADGHAADSLMYQNAWPR
jgi:hypothetical protein